MATYEAVRTVTLPIGAAVTRYRAAILNASGVAANPAAAGDDVQYIIVEDVDAATYDSGNGQTEVTAVDIQAGGVAKIEAAEAIAVGAPVRANADGRAADTLAAGNTIIGVAMDAASAAGQIIRVKLSKSIN